MTLPGYRVLGTLVRGRESVLERARRDADGASVLLRRSARAHPSVDEAEMLRREHELLAALDVKGVARPRELVRHEGGTWLVLEDPGGEPLADLIGKGGLDVGAFLPLAIRLCEVLSELHERDVLHRRIAPSSLLVDPGGGGVALVDASLAVRGRKELRIGGKGGPPSGDLDTISPEQTGRMNHPVDHRSDLYSLGATFYEMLTGAPPFRSNDPLELIHAHIARTPEPPGRVREGIPLILSAVVMKLLEKSAEARYQSASGLRADLETIAGEWRANGSAAPFALASHDVSKSFLIPHRLYGREREIEELGDAFGRACEGTASLMLVSGYSGIGKTSLIDELYRSIATRQGSFITGKFDQVVRNLPFGAFIQAFRGLVQQLLTVSEEGLARRRARIEDALGGNGGVLTEVIPEIELVIGPQPPAVALPPAETLNRFRLVVQNFVGAVASRAHPLVIFLDDLQWADAASLALLPSLLTSPEIKGLFLIGAYRDNEVDQSHLLTRSLAELSAAGARVERIGLAPLGHEHLARLLADCLRREPEEVGDLARLLLAKTEGNPFFVRQFLANLHQEGLIELDREAGRWRFRIEEVARAPMTDNVIDLMTHRIQRLSDATQHALTVAACVGNPFDLATLAVVGLRSRQDAMRDLREAIDQGLLLEAPSNRPSTDGAGEAPALYAFLHDRVQQAAYGRLPEESRKSLHLAVGRWLLDRWDRAASEEKVFEIVSHLNLGRGLISGEDERMSLARLNLVAGQRAKASTAYHAALGYLTAGLELVPETVWEKDYPLLFALHCETAETEYLCGRFDEAERRLEDLTRRARSPLDKAQVVTLRVIQYETMSRFAEAARIGREGLRLLGVSFPEDEPGKRAALDAEIAAIEDLLSGRPIRVLSDLPVMTDPTARMVVRLLTMMWAPAYVSGDATLAFLASARNVSLSIRLGHAEDSAYGYVTHAISVGPLRGDYASAYEWGSLALAVNERFADARRGAKIHQQFNAHVTYWRRPLATCIPHAQEACRAGLQSGDFSFAGYGAMTEGWAAFLIGNDLDRFARDFQPTLELLLRIGTTMLASAHQVLLGWGRALQGRTEAPGSLSDATFQESRLLAEHGSSPLVMMLFHLAKLHLATLHEDHAEALDLVRRARALPWGMGTIWPVFLEFWGALAWAWSQDEPRAGEDGAVLEAAERKRLGEARRRLEVLAENAPENFRCWALLLAAEEARLNGSREAACRFYDDAIRYARQTESLQNEALANELCGRLWAGASETVAGVFLSAARGGYRRWGAHAKVRLMDAKYPFLARAAEAAETAEAPSLDARSVTKAAHALSREIVLEDLLRKLMRIALENAGAERGWFLQEKDGRLVVEAEGRVGGDTVNVLASTPIDAWTGPSAAVAHYVRKTGESVVLGEAGQDPRFAGDPYIRAAKPRSILCMPVVHQGKTGGILYLENNLAPDAFTADRIEFLEVISSQAAISLQNARLFREKAEEAERRRLAQEELRKALDEVESLKNRLEAENVYLQEEIRQDHNFEEMVGRSPALLEVLRMVERVAPTGSTVLITGETGTGKELVARAIHSRSARRDRPLVKVNCGAIAAGLVESELFGHVKGAFTGALAARTGRFDLADGGTLFLDEVGELPLETQVKLLRVLQEQEFEPVGSSRTRRVDVRVIAATNRGLDDAVSEGRFRADLLYRLNVFPLRVPPLRERRADIPLLIGFFVTGFAKRLGKPIEGFGRVDMERLTSYAWPGNVRELQNVVERAAILAHGPVLRLDRDLGEPGESGAAPLATPRSTIEAVEHDHIKSVLETTRGVVEGPRGAAKILGLNPSTLRSRMKKLGIDPHVR